MAGIKFGNPSFRIGKPEGGIKFPQSTGVLVGPFTLTTKSGAALTSKSGIILQKKAA